ncbi:periplasmic nitrate reductase, NapE protein [Psychrobacter jeotgali]|uniref:periplasmic nitrate reductase, NapE protein n=1 Tax=Psychrobacter jeotgali TaxID=179010 RepID=UPI001D12390B|nr:periplasmic nitrate reductase, NapE protein [Psychrobacter jeotgali]
MSLEKQLKREEGPVKHQWLSALVMAFIALPFIALLFVAAYGFIVWFGQMLFWGPPT